MCYRSEHRVEKDLIRCFSSCAVGTGLSFVIQLYSVVTEFPGTLDTLWSWLKQKVGPSILGGQPRQTSTNIHVRSSSPLLAHGTICCAMVPCLCSHSYLEQGKTQPIPPLLWSQCCLCPCHPLCRRLWHLLHSLTIDCYRPNFHTEWALLVRARTCHLYILAFCSARTGTLQTFKQMNEA